LSKLTDFFKDSPDATKDVLPGIWLVANELIGGCAKQVWEVLPGEDGQKLREAEYPQERNQHPGAEEGGQAGVIEAKRRKETRKGAQDLGRKGRQ